MASSTPAADASEVQQATRIIAVRHGETAWNAETRMQGQLDVPLNARGRWQAARMAAALADEPLDTIYSSDLSRAAETADALAAAVGLPVIAVPALRERCFGAFEGLTFDEVQARWPEQGRRWRQRDPDFAPHGGETLHQFFARCVDVAAELAAAHPGRTIALVAHGGVMDCLYRAASRIDLQAPRSWQLGNASINRVLYTPEGFMLIGWADTFHLDETRDETADKVGSAA